MGHRKEEEGDGGGVRGEQLGGEVAAHGELEPAACDNGRVDIGERNRKGAVGQRSHRMLRAWGASARMGMAVSMRH